MHLKKLNKQALFIFGSNSLCMQQIWSHSLCKCVSQLKHRDMTLIPVKYSFWSSMLMKAIGLCEWRLLFQSFILQPSVEYTSMETPLECFITDPIPGVASTPHHTHTLPIMHVEDMRVNWMPFHLLRERFDCIFNAAGYKHDIASRQQPTLQSCCWATKLLLVSAFFFLVKSFKNLSYLVRCA